MKRGIVLMLVGSGCAGALAADINLGPLDGIAIDQPRVLFYFTEPGTDTIVGPNFGDNTGLLDTGANGLLLSSGAYDLQGFHAPFTPALNSDGQPVTYYESGVSGVEAMTVYQTYDMQFSGLQGTPVQLVQNVHAFGNPSVDLGVSAVIGMPAMAGRVVQIDPKPITYGFSGFDLTQTQFYTTPPAPNTAVSYNVPLPMLPYQHAGVDPLHPDDPLPTYADLPLIDIFTSDKGTTISQRLLVDTGGQMSIISVTSALAMGLVLTDAAQGGDIHDYMPIGGIGGTVNMPLVMLDRLVVPTLEGDSLVVSNAVVGVLDIEGVDGVLGMNFLITGYADRLFAGTGEYGAFSEITMDFRNPAEGVMRLDVNPEYLLHTGKTWTRNGGDLAWETPANWTLNTLPVAFEPVAFTSGGLSAGETVVLSSDQMVGQLTFDTNNLTIGGTGTLTLNDSMGIVVKPTAVGIQTINVPVALTPLDPDISILTPPDREWRIESTGGLVVNGALSGESRLTKSGLGPLKLAGSMAGFTGDIAVRQGALRFSGAAIPTVARNGLFVTGGTAEVEAGSGKALFVSSVLASGSGKIDITDGGMVVDYTGDNPLATIQAYLASGYASGAWNGNGINSSTAAANAGMTLGMADNASLGLSTFGGGAVDSTSILVKYTYNGDLNFDGMVNGVDLSILGSSWQGTGLWANGDLNYDGTINGVDLSLLGANWQAGVAAPLNVSFAEAAGAMGMSVPEPASLAVVGLGTLALALRRRRHG